MEDMNKNEFNLLNELEQIIIVIDPVTKNVISTNDYTLTLLGDITKLTCYQFLHNVDELKDCPWGKKNACSCNSLNGVAIQEVYNEKANKVFEVRSRNSKFENKECILVTATDITKRKQAEEALKFNEEKFHSIFNSYIDVFFQANMDGRLTLISPSCFKLTGYNLDELLKINLNSIIIDDTSNIDILSQIKNTKNNFHKQFYLISKDSNKVPVVVRCKMVLDNENKPLFIEGIIHDNSERLKVETELKEALLKAEEADRIRNEFVANMNHELRTPLNGILGFAQILKNDSDSTTKQLEGINIIEKSANHLLGLINDILDLSKIDSDKMELQTASFDFEEILKTIYGMASIKAKSKNVGVILNRKNDLPKTVVGDKKRLSQVLLNLLNNAIKFTDFGKVTLNVSYKNDRAHFEVIDTGYGIPKDKIDKIFMPFRQLSDYRLKSEGTGLGLPISKKIIEMMGGAIQVESIFGKGSKFSFDVELRAIDNDESIMTSDKQIVGYDGDTKTILIADDEPTDRQLLKTILQPKGFEIMEAADGIDVLQLIDKKIPDLILLDLLMPQLSGDDLVRELKNSEKFRSIPIIVVSACNPKDYETTLKELELNSYLIKPISEDSLYSFIEKEVNIKWSYVTGKEETSNEPEKELIYNYPSEDEISELYSAINKRNFSKFHNLLEVIESKDNDYSEFVKDMRTLAITFNANKIRKELETIMDN
jgi:PAS domain S-box-containing protein